MQYICLKIITNYQTFEQIDNEFNDLILIDQVMEKL